MGNELGDTVKCGGDWLEIKLILCLIGIFLRS